MKIAVLGDEDTVTGFQFAGIKKSLLLEKADKRSLAELAEDSGVLIVTEKAMEKFKEQLETLGKQDFPIIVEIPDKYGTIRRDKFKQLVKKAIGVELARGD